MSSGGDIMAGKEREEEENMAAWLLGIKNLKIQPYHLPSLGKAFTLFQVKNTRSGDHSWFR